MVLISEDVLQNLGQVRSCEGWETVERRRCECDLLFSVVQFGLDYWLCHNIPVIVREDRIGKLGDFSSSWTTETINISRSYSRSLSLCHCVLYGKREMDETLLVFLFWFPSADKRQCGWQGQGGTVAWLVHSSPLHPTRRNSTDTVSGRAQSNNEISLLHSLLALSKRLIQRIAASPYLHTNKREDVDSYRCLPPSACLRVSGYLPVFPSFSSKSCGDVRLEKPLGLLRAIRAPPLTLIRQHKEDMNDKYDWGLISQHHCLGTYRCVYDSLLNKGLCHIGLSTSSGEKHKSELIYKAPISVVFVVSIVAGRLAARSSCCSLFLSLARREDHPRNLQ